MNPIDAAKLLADFGPFTLRRSDSTILDINGTAMIQCNPPIMTFDRAVLAVLNAAIESERVLAQGREAMKAADEPLRDAWGRRVNGCACQPMSPCRPCERAYRHPCGHVTTKNIRVCVTCRDARPAKKGRAK